MQRLDRLITDISHASRVDNEIIGHGGTVVDFANLLENFIQLRDQTFAKITLAFDKPDSPVMVAVNESRIVQVIDNILGNAVSFSPDRGTITFLLRKDNSAGCAELDICDQGVGIPENRLETIFNRFYSERPRSETFGEHSGLGLSIARQITEAHGGALIASNRPEGGACFHLRLPLITG